MSHEVSQFSNEQNAIALNNCLGGRMKTRVLPEYGGQIPDSIHDPDAPAQTEEEYILARIEYYKNNDHLSDMKTVQQLLRGRVVSSGRDGWRWLKKWYEKEQAEVEKYYKEANNIIAKSIDDINSRLKGFEGV